MRIRTTDSLARVDSGCFSAFRGASGRRGFLGIRGRTLWRSQRFTTTLISESKADDLLGGFLRAHKRPDDSPKIDLRCGTPRGVLNQSKHSRAAPERARETATADGNRTTSIRIFRLALRQML